MASEDTTGTEGEQPEPKPAPKMSLRTLILLASEAFPFETERLGTVQGRSLSGAMETALTERLPENGELGNLEVSRIFMGCSCGIAEEAGKPVFNPLTPAQAAELTDADVAGYARPYLARIAKASVSGDPVAQLAAYAREQRARIADDLAKHGKTVRDSIRSISANSSIMQNWKELQDSVHGSAVDLQREFLKAMGPAERATDAIRDAIDAIQRPSMATDSIREAMEAAEAHNRSIEAALGGSLQETMKEFRRQIEFPGASALEELSRRVEGPGAKAFEELRRQMENSPAEQLRRAIEDQPTSFEPSSRLHEPIELPRLPPLHETPLGRTAIAVEHLREAGGRMEAAMDIIVSQAGEVSKLIGEVSGTIQVEARQFQTQSEGQTKKAMRYARWSLVVAAIALAFTAWVSALGYRADRADARSQDADSKAMIELLRDQNNQLRSLVQKQTQVPAPKVQTPPPPRPKLPTQPPAPTKPKPASKP